MKKPLDFRPFLPQNPPSCAKCATQIPLTTPICVGGPDDGREITDNVRSFLVRPRHYRLPVRYERRECSFRNADAVVYIYCPDYMTDEGAMVRLLDSYRRRTVNTSWWRKAAGRLGLLSEIYGEGE